MVSLQKWCLPMNGILHGAVAGLNPSISSTMWPQKRSTVISAIHSGAMVNLDSLEEVEMVCRAFSSGESCNLKLGIRVNFDLEAECPDETTCTGVPGRFGICLENGDFARAIEMLKQSGIPLSGLHMHQSSRTRSRKIFAAISQKAAEIARTYHLQDISYVDIGGGILWREFLPGKTHVSGICGDHLRNIEEHL